jgi:thioesterase domain-containing protein
MWKELLGQDEISVTANFFDLGGNSLLGATFVNRLQEQMSEYLYLIAIFDAPTIASLARYLQENYMVGVAKLLGEKLPEGVDLTSQATLSPSQLLKTSQQQPLVPIQPNGTKPPLFLAHAAGGFVFTYYSLIPHMGKDQPLYGLQDPSCYSEETFYSSLEEMAAAYIEWIQKVQPKGPYHLAGWSFGGGLAFAIAQQLIKKGEEVALLAVIDTGMKTTDRRKALKGKPKGRKLSLINLLKRPFRVFASVITIVKDVMPYIRSGLFALISGKTSVEDKKNSLSKAFNKIRGIALTTEFLQGSELAELATQEKHLINLKIPSSMGRVLQLIPVHQKFGKDYKPESYPGKIVLIRSDYNKEAVEKSGLNLYQGWDHYAEKGVELIWTAGNHASLFSNPDVEQLANHLKRVLKEASQEGE